MIITTLRISGLPCSCCLRSWQETNGFISCSTFIINQLAVRLRIIADQVFFLFDILFLCQKFWLISMFTYLPRFPNFFFFFFYCPVFFVFFLRLVFKIGVLWVFSFILDNFSIFSCFNLLLCYIFPYLCLHHAKLVHLDYHSTIWGFPP